ncbi:hypothetical protein PN466_16085 [Roseofilum reptotaenium CS-1145]|uniref:Uncharacterized protein n=1 Tax=Roseofilum reptotaenium AO1-A TaxID=1925591 RepID=A0A1L9QTR3_9CYAN|nr:hypothetical protein [Roseofilum reptotaenium]MDB9518464.1 hypothetical protein [Roseofilum reptotaenium CS-1145]OJJ26058.1 hypothetical protein BI308_07635 [Roseofilum reptotaenium AO1-A]
MTYFSGKNLELIEALVYDPTLKPDYDIMRDSLVWPDERPWGLDPDAYDKLIDLWIARSFIHKGIPFSDWSFIPEMTSSLHCNYRLQSNPFFRLIERGKFSYWNRPNFSFFSAVMSHFHLLVMVNISGLNSVIFEGIKFLFNFSVKSRIFSF